MQNDSAKSLQPMKSMGFIALGLCFLTACNPLSSESASRGKPKPPPSAGPTAAPALGPDGRPLSVGFPDAGIRQDVDVDYGNDNQALYVPARVVYDGSNAGQDAVFTFFLQRAKPAPERIKREIIKALGKGQSNEATIEKVCRCGQENELLFYWEHQATSRRGGLHSVEYDRDNKLQGDWIVASHVSDSNWLKGSLQSLPQNAYTTFFGADTENPMFILDSNPQGNGFLRTWAYMPNSPFGSKEHRWDTRDDMRLGISCLVERCTDGSGPQTTIRFRMHRSHDPSWILP